MDRSSSLHQRKFEKFACVPETNYAKLNGRLRLALRDWVENRRPYPDIYIYIFYIYVRRSLTLYVHALQKGERTKRNRERLILFSFITVLHAKLVRNRK